jgi:hypothetical protein
LIVLAVIGGGVRRRREKEKDVLQVPMFDE